MGGKMTRLPKTNGSAMADEIKFRKWLAAQPASEIIRNFTICR